MPRKASLKVSVKTATKKILQKKKVKYSSGQKRSTPSKDKSAADAIVVRGARVHNLKNIDVDIPRGAFTVVTGLSGSGKSSLAFDTIYAEGNRRYMESLSSYARSILDVGAKPDVDKIENLSPTIAIDQKSIMRSPRSTVGTMTEIYDYLRILFARAGSVQCPDCAMPMHKTSHEKIYSTIEDLAHGSKCIVLAPLSDYDKETHELLRMVSQLGYARVRFNGKIITTDEAILVADAEVTSIDVVIDRMTVSKNGVDRERVIDSIETAMRLGKGSVIISHDTDEKRFNRDFKCGNCGTVTADITPRHFSFNNPEGACAECSGLGTVSKIDPNLLIPNKKLSIEEGALRLMGKVGGKMEASGRTSSSIADVAKRYKFSLSTPVAKLSKAQLAVIFYGVPDDDHFDTKTIDGAYSEAHFPGVISQLEKKYHESRSEHMRSEIEKYMTKCACTSCHGRRLKLGYLSVFFCEKSIDDVVQMPIGECIEFFESTDEKCELSGDQKKIAQPLVREIIVRLQALENVGVGYLNLHRSTETLSGGEAQRIRLAVQIKSELMGMIYVLDEPSVGLHPRDTQKLITTLTALRDSGNTLIVVEHDADIMHAAQCIIDMGPGAGENGGEVLFSGSYKQLAKSKTPTAGYLAGTMHVSEKSRYRAGSKKAIEIVGACAHNLKSVSVKIPLEKFIVVAGVSGGGKSTLISHILSRALAQHFYKAHAQPGEHKKITGLSHINKVISINQQPIGRTPRSNAATYTGVFSHIRELFAATDEACDRGYSATQFSFNMRGGRCEACQGDGMTKVEMQLLPDVYVSCETCSGTRYSASTREVEYNGVTIYDVLDMSVSYALTFFSNQKAIVDKLQVLEDVGLGYLKLGQSAPSLSGGEAQRVKLATELARKSTGKTLYILDEPTTGLHFEDTKRLLGILDTLVDKGNTVLVVEHNVDVIRHADHVIELGPEGGDAGGDVVFTGTPKSMKKSKKSPTAKFL